MNSPFNTRCDASGIQVEIPLEFLVPAAEAVFRLGERLQGGKCPALEGQGPGARFSMDATLQSECAGLLDDEVRERKVRNLKVFTEALSGREAENGQIRIPLDRVALWLASLNDLRLMLAEERGFAAVMAAQEEPNIEAWDMAIARDWLLFMLLSYVQEDVLRVLGGKDVEA